MYYEVYIDVLFLINFMMDYLLLLIVRRVLKCTATHGNICVGSIFGAAAVCICMLLPVRSTLIRFLLFHLSVNAAMIWIGLKIRTLREFLKAFAALYASAFLLGGVFTWLQPYVRAGSLFFGAAVGSYYLVIGIWKFLLYLQRMNKYQYTVTVYTSGESCTMHALQIQKKFPDPDHQIITSDCCAKKKTSRTHIRLQPCKYSPSRNALAYNAANAFRNSLSVRIFNPIQIIAAFTDK